MAILRRWVQSLPVEQNGTLFEEELILDVGRARGGRSLHMTRDGFLISGPRGCQPGDQVVVLLGCYAPVIVRPTYSPNGTLSAYRVIGPSYHPGLASGEGLLGPMTPDWRLSWIDVNDPHQTFKNENGSTSLHDPRLEGVELPKGWIELLDNNGSPYWWFYDGQQHISTGNDPRLKPEELKARGVPVETFVLV